MPTFLSDPPFAVYVSLIVVLIVSGMLWLSRRERKSSIAFGCAISLLAAIVLLDHFFESPREESKRRVNEMVEASNARNPEAFLSHVADTLQYQGESSNPIPITKEQLRNSGFWGILRQFDVRVAAWDFDRNDVTRIDDDTIEIGFLASGKADGKQIPMYFRAKFTRQSDGQMKLSGLASYDPLKRTKERQSIPNFP
jgi:hypothetical protein